MAGRTHGAGDRRKGSLVDTSKDLAPVTNFFNRTIRRYEAFDGFFGMEDTIERIVSYFRHAAQGLEENARFCISRPRRRRQILYRRTP
ncbi:MAG: hypothetical protein R3C40_00145 [Parvularculaceae bacterium]